MSVVENLKQIADLIKKAGDIELYRKIIESEGEAIELTRENRRLEDRVAVLEKTLSLQKKMVHKPPFYFQEGDPTPFCSPCWENKKLAIHVLFAHDNEYEVRWDCPTCKQMFLIRKNVPHNSEMISGGGPDSWMAR